MGADKGSRRERWKQICRRTGNCSFCKPNKGENRKRQAKPDKYKNKDRESIRPSKESR